MTQPHTEPRRKSFELTNIKLAEPAEGEAPSGKFEGIASAVGVLDRHNEIIATGAFDRTLEDKGPTFVLLWQHDPGKPIGVINLSTDARGDLIGEGELNLDTQLGKEAYSLLKQGAVGAMSIGFNIPDGAAAFDQKSGVMHILAVDLWEVSLVTFPANPAAEVTGVKTALDLLVDEVKAGAVLSKKNKGLVTAARDALNDLLAAAGDDAAGEKQTVGPDPAIGPILDAKRLIQEMRQTLTQRTRTDV